MSTDTRPPGFLNSGQISCHDSNGQIIACTGTGQDGEYRTGQAWPEPRFRCQDALVTDLLTGLVWSRDANPAEFPLSWQEALDFIQQMNSDAHHGHSDWRLPNRRELRSLISHQTRRPALPQDHPFTQVFHNWYWTSTSSAAHPDHAWYVNMDGGRMFYGGKDQAFMVWPVRGRAHSAIPCTGQIHCYDNQGQPVGCHATGQDAEFACGRVWPDPRFEIRTPGIVDHLTGLMWWQAGSLGEEPVSWQQALDQVNHLNQIQQTRHWRLPNINELESLVDAGCFSPALPADHPFEQTREIYWSSSSSLYEPDWAWALYMDKGAVGVGQKHFARFHAWAVSDADAVG